MNFTTKSRYAVNALADLEYLSNDESPVSLKDIAIRQDIDLTYLEQLFSCLLYTSPSPRDATLSRMPSSA